MHWRVVEAAFALFSERGYAGATMAQIAEAAGVAVQTLYFAFHTKAALLSRANDFAVMGAGAARPAICPETTSERCDEGSAPDATQLATDLATITTDAAAAMDSIVTTAGVDLQLAIEAAKTTTTTNGTDGADAEDEAEADDD
jgi:AcrR family transcriptional regulator